MGRPKFKIDYDLAAKLAHIQCTQIEIANFLGCSVDTLQRDEKFCGIYKKGIEEGKASLRRLQWKGAEAGNATMLVWLGKQYLGQTDKMENTHKGGLSLTHMGDDELDRKLKEFDKLGGTNNE